MRAAGGGENVPGTSNFRVYSSNLPDGKGFRGDEGSRRSPVLSQPSRQWAVSGFGQLCSWRSEMQFSGIAVIARDQTFALGRQSGADRIWGPRMTKLLQCLWRNDDPGIELRENADVFDEDQVIVVWGTSVRDLFRCCRARAQRMIRWVRVASVKCNSMAQALAVLQNPNARQYSARF